MPPSVPRTDVPLPRRMKGLPRDARGYVVPWFVDWRDGKPVFPVFDPAKWRRAIRFRRCWVCGDNLGQFVTFAVGPMCVINRITSEPPCYVECATYSVKVCPFLINPHMGRVPASKVPGGSIIAPAGLHDDGNPGVMVLWITDQYHVEHLDNGDLLAFGDPHSVTWWTKGREATPQEAADAFQAGAAKLRRVAQAEGAEAVAEFHILRHRAALSLPDPGLIREAAA
jgi:hypothetical protein